MGIRPLLAAAALGGVFSLFVPLPLSVCFWHFGASAAGELDFVVDALRQPWGGSFVRSASFGLSADMFSGRFVPLPCHLCGRNKHMHEYRREFQFGRKDGRQSAILYLRRVPSRASAEWGIGWLNEANDRRDTSIYAEQ